MSVRLVAELERGARPNVSLETALQLLDAVGITLRLSTADVPAGRDAPPRDPEIDRQERAARSAARRASWVGALASRAELRPPPAPSSIAARLAAVTRASAMVYALARGVERVADPMIASGQRRPSGSRSKTRSKTPRSTS